MTVACAANVALLLTESAQRWPDRVAVAAPGGRARRGKRSYQQITFRELDQDSDRLAAGLQSMGVVPGTRLVLMVRPGIDFISLTFALFKVGAIVVLVDPGMGRTGIVDCLQQVRPDGFIAASIVQAVRVLSGNRFGKARHNVTVGRRWFWKGPTVQQLRATADAFQRPQIEANDPAAIIFTTGSTGPPKGVLYRHGNFTSQVSQLQQHYGIQPGEVDLAAFPLFALFNGAMGVTTVIPDMDFTRPARVNPCRILEAARDWNITQAFASPALWEVVGQYCHAHGETMSSLRRVLSAGAPVPPHVLQQIVNVIHADGDMHTPYGATEALPVASISASEVLSETAASSRQGAGTCVGRRFSGIQWKVIQITDAAINGSHDMYELPRGQIGELVVRGAVVTTEYITRVEANALSKIADGHGAWHRMGDVGYIDQQDRFWFCGRKAHRVLTPSGLMYTVPCEAIYNQHPHVRRSALVGLGQSGSQRPAIIVEPTAGQMPRRPHEQRTFETQLRELGVQHDHTRDIGVYLFHPSFPVDIRHNAKIFREKLAVWAGKQVHNECKSRKQKESPC